jgi:TolB-like protein/Tfp pilus assembly protein PilF
MIPPAPMKLCPACQLTYTDDAMKFCRQDGTPLIGADSSESSTTAILPAREAEADFRTRSLADSPSIAVLPFLNLSADPENEFFCDGLAEEFLNALSRIDGLKVAARTSAFSFRGKDINVSEICRILSVTTVMEGSVRKSGRRLRITVQLVDAAGFQVWSEKYDRGMEDIFALQDEITLAVVAALKVKLLGEEPPVLKGRTDDTEAYELYLRGRYCWNKRTGDDIKRAIDLFEQAIVKDPNFALAYVGLADCYTNIGVYAGTHASRSLPQAKAAALRAIQIDDLLAEGHASLGQVYYRLLNWEQAEKEYQRAIALNRNYAVVHHWYSELYRAHRRFPEAALEMQKAQELDPLSHVFGSLVGEAYYNLGDNDAAIKEWERVIELEPNFPLPHFFLGHAYATQGQYEDAIAESQKAVDLSNRGGLFLGCLGYAYAVSGRTSEAIAILDELKRKYAAGDASGYSLAHLLAGLKDNDQALGWLEKDFEAGNTTLLAQVAYSPIYDQLHAEARYRALLTRMGIRTDDWTTGAKT